MKSQFCFYVTRILRGLLTLRRLPSWLLLVALGSTNLAMAQDDALIRKNLSERLPGFPKIEEINKTPMDGIFEVRANGSDIFYTNADGSFLIQGSLTDTKLNRNLTQERVEKLTAIAFDDLPLKNAIKIVRGNGKRKLAVFEDPNCGYCKRFQRDLQNVNDITVYLFLYPILGPDSIETSKHVWCAKDRGQAWLNLMLRDQPPEKSNCDTSVIEKNLSFGKKYRLGGTPTLIFANGSRVPGAINAQEVEKRLTQAKGS